MMLTSGTLCVKLVTQGCFCLLLEHCAKSWEHKKDAIVTSVTPRARYEETAGLPILLAISALYKWETRANSEF